LLGLRHLIGGYPNYSFSYKVACVDFIFFCASQHHCRNCKRVVCGSCSSQSEVIPGLSKRKVRVCDECVPKLQRSNFKKMIQPTAECTVIVFYLK